MVRGVKMPVSVSKNSIRVFPIAVFGLMLAFNCRGPFGFQHSFRRILCITANSFHVPEPGANLVFQDAGNSLALKREQQRLRLSWTPPEAFPLGPPVGGEFISLQAPRTRVEKVRLIK